VVEAFGILGIGFGESFVSDGIGVTVVTVTRDVGSKETVTFETSKVFGEQCAFGIGKGRKTRSGSSSGGSGGIGVVASSALTACHIGRVG